jgi:hypothetical protein
VAIVGLSPLPVSSPEPARKAFSPAEFLPWDAVNQHVTQIGGGHPTDFPVLYDALRVIAALHSPAR